MTAAPTPLFRHRPRVLPHLLSHLISPEPSYDLADGGAIVVFVA